MRGPPRPRVLRKCDVPVQRKYPGYSVRWPGCGLAGRKGRTWCRLRHHRRYRHRHRRRADRDRAVPEARDPSRYRPGLGNHLFGARRHHPAFDRPAGADWRTVLSLSSELLVLISFRTFYSALATNEQHFLTSTRPVGRLRREPLCFVLFAAETASDSRRSLHFQTKEI